MDPIIEQLSKRISTMGTAIYMQNGLGLMSIIDDIFKTYGYTSPVPYQTCQKFREGLALLRQTEMPQNYIDNRLASKVSGGIENQRLVFTNGEWDSVNMLNTSYKDLSDMLATMVYRSILGENSKKGYEFLERCTQSDVRKAFMDIKPHLKALLIKYFVNQGGLEDFKKFTRFTTKNQIEGERYENIIEELLIQNGFSIEYRGGKGDFIDMIFGVDMIVSHLDFGMKTIQVKPTIYWDRVQHYMVDWVAEGRTKQIFDKKQKTVVDIEREQI